MKTWLPCLAVFAFSLNAVAQTSSIEDVVSRLKQERAAGRDGPLMFGISGAGRAYAIANSRLRLRGSTELYCPPEKFALTVSNYAGIALEQYERDRSTLNTLPFAQEYGFDMLLIVLMNGLQRTFPCK